MAMDNKVMATVAIMEEAMAIKDNNNLING
jgi:hypothetical protein